MRHETVLKIIIGFFAIMLIVLATFVYGNVQRSKQKSQNNPSTNTEQAQQNNQSTPKNDTANPTPATPPAVVPTSPAQTSSTNIPATGANDAVLPSTILGVLGYIIYHERKLIRSKSKREPI